MNRKKRAREWYDDLQQDTKGVNTVLHHTEQGYSVCNTKRHFVKPPAASRIVKHEVKRSLPHTGVGISSWNIHGQRQRTAFRHKKTPMVICGIPSYQSTVSELLPPNHYGVQHGQEVDNGIPEKMDVT